MALRAVAITIRHAPEGKDPVTPQVLRLALSYLHCLRDPRAVRLALLLMYIVFLRQSSVAPPTVAAFDPTGHPRTFAPLGLHIKVKWTKTLQSSADATSILRPPTRDAALCPVTAYKAYLEATPSPASSQAPLIHHPDGNPLTINHIQAWWVDLLDAAGLQSSKLTLHSLRKGPAQYSYNEGKADLNDVMHQGTWRSQAVRCYIRQD